MLVREDIPVLVFDPGAYASSVSLTQGILLVWQFRELNLRNPTHRHGGN
jgi:hypothetical protein